MHISPRHWLIWAVAAGATFGVLEWAGYRSTDGHTLTAVTRRVLGIDPPQPWRRAGQAAAAGGLAVLASHIVVGRP